jgi:DNA-binding NtrC family response regulator
LHQRSTEKSAGQRTTDASAAEQQDWSAANSRSRAEGVILLVDTKVAALRRAAEAIRRAGYDVVEAASFDEAKRALMARRPALLVSSLRLAAYNGLHLVHLGRLGLSTLGAIIISSGADAMLQAEAERVGASILQEPVPTGALLALIDRLLDVNRVDPPEAPVPVERRTADRRGREEMVFVTERRIAGRRIADGPSTK